MNIFGVGGMELGLILIIMLIVAGPKRMIQWAYVVGTYTAKLRRMWEETVDLIQKEVDDAGLDIQVPKDLPTRANLNREISKVMKPVVAPVEEALSEVGDVKRTALNGKNGTADAAKPSTDAPKPSTAAKPAATPVKPSTSNFVKPAAPKPEPPPATPPASSGEFGTWSGGSAESQD
jgi:sec-independent protein translocase protein TatB